MRGGTLTCPQTSCSVSRSASAAWEFALTKCVWLKTWSDPFEKLTENADDILLVQHLLSDGRITAIHCILFHLDDFEGRMVHYINNVFDLLCSLHRNVLNEKPLETRIIKHRSVWEDKLIDKEAEGAADEETARRFLTLVSTDEASSVPESFYRFCVRVMFLVIFQFIEGVAHSTLTNHL